MKNNPPLSALHLETRLVRAAAEIGHKSAPLVPPIYQTATFEASDIEQQRIASKSDRFYTRYGNPTHTAAAKLLADLEGAESALLFSSGMAAITTAILTVVKKGDHIVCQRDIFGGTMKFLTEWLPKFGVETTFVETTHFEEYEKAIRPHTRLLYLESPTNPTLKIVDLERMVDVAKRHKVLTFIDSTLATPINLCPLEWGIDLVLHSATKYLSGHSDLMCGAAVGGQKLIEGIYKMQNELGGIMDPHAVWQLMRGVKTLALRVRQQNENALQIAQYLAQHPKVKQVYYPFLPQYPQYALAKKQMKGGGGLLSFELNTKGDDTKKVVEALRLFSIAPSLGGVESMVTIPTFTTHAMLSEEQRRAMGITEQLVRLAIGIEHISDLIADLEQAFEK